MNQEKEFTEFGDNFTSLPPKPYSDSEMKEMYRAILDDSKSILFKFPKTKLESKEQR